MRIKDSYGSAYIEFIFSVLFIIQLVTATADLARLEYAKSILRFNLTKALKTAENSDTLYTEIWQLGYNNINFSNFRNTRRAIINSTLSSTNRFLPGGVELRNFIHVDVDNSGTFYNENALPFAMLLPGASVQLDSGSYSHNEFSCLDLNALDDCDGTNVVNTSTELIEDLSNTYPLHIVSVANFRPMAPFLSNFDFKISVSGYRILRGRFTMPPVNVVPPPGACDPAIDDTQTACMPKDLFQAHYNYTGEVQAGAYPPLTDDFVGFFHNDLMQSISHYSDLPINLANGVDSTLTEVCGERNDDNYTSEWSCGPVDMATCEVSCVRDETFGGCFTADTLIETDSGIVRVKDLNIDHKIFNPFTHEYISINKVVSGPESKPVFEITTESGKSIVVTEGHPMMALSGEIRADEVTVGSSLVMSDGTDEKVILVNSYMLPATEKVYNIDLLVDANVKNKHVFSANNFASGDLYIQELLAD